MTRTYCLFILLNCILSLSLSAQQQKNENKLFFEKVYLHTDRDYYTYGDDIWIKAYLINGQTGHLSTTSNNLYLELISPSSKMLDRKLVRLDNGMGKADFQLGDSTEAGTYRIRAYTSWMRNFGDIFLFEKTVRVYSSKSSSENKTTLAGIGSQSPVTNSPASGTRALAPATPSLRFFPEGGSLIEGVVSMVAFKAENSEGKGVAVKGSIQTSTGEPVSDFEANSTGLGSFMINPLPGLSYEVTGTFGNGNPFKTKLPSALSKGFSMYIKNADTTILAMISTNETTFGEQQGKQVVILGKSHGKSCFSAIFNLNTPQISISIPKSKFPEGIAALTLYDANGKPQSERLVFIENSKKTTLSVTVDKPVYQPKEQATVSLKATDENGQPVKASLSLAIVDAGVVPDDSGDILSYLRLQSELKGKIDKPGQYFDEKNPNRKRQLDLLLLTQGWRDFIWKRLADSALKISYPLEQGITVSGKVRQLHVDKPLPGINITLTAFRAKGNRLFSAVTDSAGKFYIDGTVLFGQQPLKISSTVKGERKGWIILDPIYSTTWPEVPVLSKGIDSSALGFEKSAAERITLLNKQSIKMSEIVLKAKKPTQLWGIQVKPTPTPDEEFNITPQEQKEYKSLRHYLIHKVQYNNGITGDSIRVRYNSIALGKMGMKIVYGPRLFVNGKELPFRDTDPREIVSSYIDTYYSMPLSSFKKVVVKRMEGFDHEALETREIYLLYLTLDISAVENGEMGSLDAEVAGYYEARSFFAPKDTDFEGKADLRTTIRWEPFVSTNEKGEAIITFNNAEPKTKVRIVAQGITDKGEPLSSILFYNVK